MPPSVPQYMLHLYIYPTIIYPPVVSSMEGEGVLHAAVCPQSPQTDQWSRHVGGQCLVSIP